MTSRVLPVLTIIAVVGVCYFPITRAHLDEGDFPDHILIGQLLTQGVIGVPHIFFHTLVAGVIVLGVEAETAALFVTLFLQIATSLSVFWLIRTSTSTGPASATVLAILVLAVGPILSLEYSRNLFMLGYFLPNAIHNPTVIAAKAFVPILLAIGVVAAGLTARPSIQSGSAATAVVLAGLAKPHYVSCIAAATVAWATVRRLRGHDVPWRLLAVGLLLPAVAVMAWASYGMIEFAGGDTVMLAPLAVLGHFVAVDAASILQRIASDIAFPLIVAALWPASIGGFPPLAIAWTAYGIGLGQAFFLAESGTRMFDGNFLWSGQLATFGLMAASAAFLGEESTKGRFAWRAIVAWAALLLHVAFGIWWVLDRVPVR